MGKITPIFRYVPLCCEQVTFYLFFGAIAPSGPWPLPHSRGLFFCITHNDTPQSVGLLWTSDQSVAETST